jgi:hypothetical protein
MSFLPKFLYKTGKARANHYWPIFGTTPPRGSVFRIRGFGKKEKECFSSFFF